ncbi:MAG: hypothetical protein KDB07_08310, partial [Planctomycetes bacterium]|nr:hypothetical protein [Planctomycetota bacterium]
EELREVARRCLTALRDIAAGVEIQPDDIGVFRPATGMAPAKRDLVIGSKLKEPVQSGDPIIESNLVFKETRKDATL